MGWIGPAVHLDKGCYRGQETVARVHTLGRPPRRLTLLHLDGSENRLPAGGADVLLGEKVVGYVGSSARHHELGPIALAVLKRNTPVDAQLLTDGIDAAPGDRGRPRGRPPRASAPAVSHLADPPAGRRRRVLAASVALGLTVLVASVLLGRRGEGEVLLVFSETHGLHSGDVPVLVAWLVGVTGCALVAWRR